MARLCARASRGTNRAMYASQLKRMLGPRFAENRYFLLGRENEPDKENME